MFVIDHTARLATADELAAIVAKRTGCVEVFGVGRVRARKPDGAQSTQENLELVGRMPAKIGASDGRENYGFDAR